MNLWNALNLSTHCWIIQRLRVAETDPTRLFCAIAHIPANMAHETPPVDFGPNFAYNFRDGLGSIRGKEKYDGKEEIDQAAEEGQGSGAYQAADDLLEGRGPRVIRGVLVRGYKFLTRDWRPRNSSLY